MRFQAADSVQLHKENVMNASQVIRAFVAAVAGIVLVTSASAHAGVLNPVSASGSSSFSVATHFASSAVDPTDLNANNEHIAAGFAAEGNWLTFDVSPTSDQWIFVDLGGATDVIDLRLWNYHEDAGTFEVNGRGIAGYELFVGTPGAALPASPGPAAAPFTGASGWTSVQSGTLTIGPSSVAPVADIGPTDVFNLGVKGIQYIGIDIASRHGADPFTSTSVGLAQIQVTTPAPEPGTFVLLGMGLIGLSIRRRRLRRA